MAKLENARDSKSREENPHAGSTPAPGTFAVILIVALILAAFVDGVLTYIGVGQRGFPEGNPFLRWLIEKIGIVPALIVTRLEACVLVCSWYWVSKGNKFLLAYFFVCVLMLLMLFLIISIIPWIQVLI